MDSSQNIELKEVPVELQALVTEFRASAKSRQGNSLAILELLRMLEALHREIRDELFQPSLPDNRQALYALLRDIEAEGGWPYIPRMKLQSFLLNLVPESAGKSAAETPAIQPTSCQEE